MLDGISFAIFAIPSAAMIAVWWGFVASWRSEKGRILALPGLVVTSITACIAIGGFVNLHRLRARSYFNYGFERHAATIAYLAVIAAVVWVVRSRTWKSWGTLAVAVWMALAWTAACATL